MADGCVVLLIALQASDQQNYADLFDCNSNGRVSVVTRCDRSGKHGYLADERLRSLLKLLDGSGGLFGAAGEGKSVADVGARHTSIEGGKAEVGHVGGIDRC